MDRMLTSAEAAARLGVKVATLYVYVSRGLLASHRAPDGRRSLFDPADIDRLAQRSRGTRRIESRLAVVATAVTGIDDAGPSYRGRPAVELAEDLSFESVAELLWQQRVDDWSPVALPDGGPVDGHARLPWAVVWCGASDPLRSDLRRSAVAAAAARTIATLATGSNPAPADPDDDVAARLVAGWAATSSGALPEGLTEVVRRALVLLADHELATSTVAVRVAASTRADPYDALLCGLGTLSGPLHGTAAGQVARLFADASERGASAALDELLRARTADRLLPGFGHAVYTAGDPRAAALLDALRRELPDRVRVVDEVLELAASAGLPDPNVDVALGALVHCAGLDAGAATLLFAVARCAGWIAHYLEELREDPLRFRARAVHLTRMDPDADESPR